jgi:nicotinamide-nucleotide amidase
VDPFVDRGIGKVQRFAGRMRAEIVAVGTELLLGQIANTNARWMSERLAEVGVDVMRHETVGDNLDRIVQSLRLAASRADVVLVCGGLGPTEDDITRDALAVVMGVEMIRHPEIEDLLRAKFERFGRGPMPENNLRQADVPRGASFIVPLRGTAPGLIADVGRARVYAMPGVPAEMFEMMQESVLPELERRSGRGVVRSQILRCTGIGESSVAEMLADLFEGSVNPSLAYLASSGQTTVRVTAKAGSSAEAEDLIGPLAREVASRLGDHLFTTSGESLEEAVGRLLMSGGKTLACAESLTGGAVGARITSVPGASAYFRGSAVVYDADSKRSVLGVSNATMESVGVVSEECAREMASGARRVFGADVALALTGVAGPEPHGGLPAGTVWIALDWGAGAHASGYFWDAERDRVRRWSEQAGLDLVRRYMEGRELPSGNLET